MKKSQPLSSSSDTNVDSPALILEAITDIIPIMVMVVGLPSRKIVYTNGNVISPPGVNSNTGIVAQPMDGPGSLIHPDDQQEIDDYYERFALLHNNEINAIEYRLRNDQGDWLTFSAHGKIFRRNKQGNATQVLMTIQDVTAQKQLLKQMEELIGIASHELKTPITTLKIYAEIVQERIYDIGLAEESILLQRVNEQIDKLTLLINNLLDTNKISEGKLSYQFERMDVNKVITQHVEEISRTSNHVFNLQPGQLPEIEVDRERISQVITNLLTNAIKYSPAATTITIRSANVPEGIQVSIQDQDAGIAPEDQLRIFDRFYRATDNTISTSPGIGLGLYISSQIIQRHGGNLHVESTPGKGSVFTFTLPLSQQQLGYP